MINDKLSDGNISDLPSLHKEIREKCLDLYKQGHYRKCVKHAFGIVRSVYKEKFCSEKIPEGFLQLYHVSGSLGNLASKEDKNFQSGCEHIFRSINNFRNEMEHTEQRRSIPIDDTIHYLYLCSKALYLLEKTEKYTNKLHPFSRNDYKNEKRKGVIKFDYSNNNGCYQIGRDLDTFTIRVSGCGDNILYILNDPEDIKGVGLIHEDVNECQLADTDMSSRHRMINTKNTGVLLNTNNIYALLKLKKANREHPHTAKIEYHIYKIEESTEEISVLKLFPHLNKTEKHIP